MMGTSRGASHRAAALVVRLALLAVLLLSAAAASTFIGRNGFTAFHWDDSEYLTSALDTFDHLTASGYLSWPRYVATKQHYGKPPLYVNLVSLGMAFTGRQHPPSAAALVAGVTVVLLGLTVAGFMRTLAGPSYGLLAAIAILGMPAVGRWSGAAFPDVQLACLVVSVCWVLVADVSSVRRVLLLGVLLGLGLLIKATFPLFVGVPLLLWAWTNTSDGTPKHERVKVLVFAGFLAAAVASVWYVSNLREALGYVRGAYAFQIPTGTTRLQGIWDWLTIMVGPGLGFSLLGLAVVVLFAARGAQALPLSDSFTRNLPAILFGGGLPMVLLALTSSTPANTRHLLPSLVLFGLGLLLVIIRALNARPYWTLVTLVWIGLSAQWVATCAGQVLGSEERQSILGGGRLLALAGPELPTSSWEAVDDVIAHAAGTWENVPASWYVVGNDSMLNASRLELAGRAVKLPLRFHHACYFAWTSDTCRTQLADLRNTPSVVILYSRPWEQHGGEATALNRHSQLAQTVLEDPQNGFRRMAALLRSGYSLTFYSTDTYRPSPAGPALIRATFGKKLVLLDARLHGRMLSLRLKPIGVGMRNYKLLLHARRPHIPRSSVQVWDQYIVPPLSTWPAGTARIVSFMLPQEVSEENLELALGFFDESDVARNWPPLRLDSGEPALRVYADDLRRGGTSMR